VTNHFAPKLITNLTGDVENCAPVLCSAEGRGSCPAGPHATLRSNLYICTKFPKLKCSRKMLQIVIMLPAEQQRAV